MNHLYFILSFWLLFLRNNFFSLKLKLSHHIWSWRNSFLRFIDCNKTFKIFITFLFSFFSCNFRFYSFSLLSWDSFKNGNTFFTPTFFKTFIFDFLKLMLLSFLNNLQKLFFPVLVNLFFLNFHLLLIFFNRLFSFHYLISFWNKFRRIIMILNFHYSRSQTSIHFVSFSLLLISFFMLSNHWYIYWLPLFFYFL